MNIISRIKRKKEYLQTLYLGKYHAKKLANRIYKKRLKRECGINWDNPKDLNEKINWLKFNSNTEEWTRLADKYLVRDFVKKRGYESALVRLLGVWKSAKDIDFNSLPNSFVIKLNNGSGDVCIVKDKGTVDLEIIRKRIEDSFNSKFGLLYAEPHYSSIKPLIIAEELLIDTYEFSTSPVDYKIWCFDGKIFGTWVCYSRTGYLTKTEWHDDDWNFHPEWSVFNEHYMNGGGIVPRPKNYEKMIEMAKCLSKGFPQVRVDLYNINGQVYFGEMTFTSAGGYMDFYSQEVLNKMGDMTILPLNKS